MTDSTPSLLDLPPPSQQSDSLASVSSDEHDVASISSSETETETDHDSDAEAEWQESMRQLELLLTMVLIPFAGKWVGRRCAFWIWARYMQYKYPVDIVMTSKAAFDIAGVVSAAAPL